MVSATHWPKIAYHIGKLTIGVGLIFPYFQWKAWKAKKAFRTELLKNGLPDTLADKLTTSYGLSNRQLMQSFRMGLTTIQALNEKER